MNDFFSPLPLSLIQQSFTLRPSQRSNGRHIICSGSMDHLVGMVGIQDSIMVYWMLLIWSLVDSSKHSSSATMM
jgi:hypothetical protein